MTKLLPALVLALAAIQPALAQQDKIVEHNAMMDHGDGHLMDMDGAMVMGQNKDKLPAGCDRISEDVQITVHGGHKYSKKFPGTMFAFDDQEWRIKPCTRLTVNFINEDNVRHQWMMHGLPKFLYDKGMFHLEVSGPGKVSGTLILPNEDKTYLVHCDLAQHMEKGMKAQLVVGKGSGVFPSIPGLTDPVIPDDYATGKAKEVEIAAVPAGTKDIGSTLGSGTPTGGGSAPSSQSSFLSGSLVLGLVLGLFGTPFAIRAAGDRFKGKSTGEVLASGLELLGELAKLLLRFVHWIYRLITRQRFLPKQ
ncbi:copper oxidase [Methylococcus sp. EFPC2]|uniref:cupredoxin domain-containing protein n=1 Tax=Methylococcus sp. EFPC2 TaxID=2812648 RepID=UPI001967E083|nr:copper oxidase [Methylococcus sp. EFPC2]QSA98243.1 copper oxidase [Methylococcus sp. EFPC2]